ncbi:zinc finger CCHC domain-containing protein 3-like [Engystomops pustulosus]|uniref:zinc finger CCHC domain-containing protein 3-like n=1 Tax=Engystomops pustulosus TaxID=76066 RepID=UPI003AFB3E6C
MAAPCGLWRETTMASDVKNTIRLFVGPRRRESVGLKFVVCDLVEDLAGICRSDVFCLQDSPKRGLYTITFYQEDKCQDFLECLQIYKATPVLENIRFLPLFGAGERPMIVHVYNPYTDIKVVMSYLENYCDSVRGGVKQKNALGIFNCKYKLWVRLKFEPAFCSGIMHPPANFCYEGVRGSLVYPGQPRFRKNFTTYGLCSAFEKVHRCWGHRSHDDGDPSDCSFCGPEDLLFEEFPRDKNEEDEEMMKERKRVKTEEEEEQTTKPVDVNGGLVIPLL